MPTISSPANPRAAGDADAVAVEDSGAGFAVSPVLTYILLLIILCSFALIRYRLRNVPLERDEGEFAYGGQLLLQGLPLYKYLYTLKMPGTYVAYAVIIAIFGQTGAGIHMGLIFVNAFTTILLFLFAARMFGRLAGLVTAATYALLSTSPSVVGLAGHATHFVVLFAVCGLWLLFEAIESGKGRGFLLAGVLFGTAFLMKQPGIFFLLWAVFYLAWIGRATHWKGLAAQLSALLFGSVLPFAAVCLLTWRSGSFHDFWFWTFTYARQYGTNADLGFGIDHLRKASTNVIAPAVGIWIIAAFGGRARRHRVFVLSFLLCSFLAVSAGLYFRVHYFILMLPAISILAGLSVSYGTEALSREKKGRYVSSIPICAFVIAFLLAIYVQRDYLFKFDGVRASRYVYEDNPFPEAVEIARYIQEHTPEHETIAVMGSEPEIYFYSQRHAATGHVCTYPILVPKYGVALQKQMEEEIESAKPDVLVWVDHRDSWVAFPKTAPIDGLMSWLKGYTQERYVVDGIVEMDKDSTVYYWGQGAGRHVPSTAHKIIIFKRKAT